MNDSILALIVLAYIAGGVTIAVIVYKTIELFKKQKSEKTRKDAIETRRLEGIQRHKQERKK